MFHTPIEHLIRIDHSSA